jgi:hypothetical protein
MVTSAKYIAALALALAVLGSPSFAKKRIQHIGADSEFPQISAARGAALRECNKKAKPFDEKTWLTEQLAVYRGCMFDRGQME